MSMRSTGSLHHGLATSHLLGEVHWLVTKHQLCEGI